MASIWIDDRSGKWLIKFHFAGKRYLRSCQTEKESDASRIKSSVEETLGFLNTGRLTMPESVSDPAVWIISGGKIESKPKNDSKRLVYSGEIFDAYILDQLDKAETTVNGERYHLKHLKRHHGERSVFGSLDLEDLQRYVNERCKEDNRFGGNVSGLTVKKELTTFMQVWDWARQRGFVNRQCPLKDPHKPRKWAVRIPKREETEKFMTWGEIERRIARGSLTLQQQAKLWQFVFLDEKQVDELLGYFRDKAAYSFIFPMIVFAAFTGARRSEICRSLIDDFKFDDDLVVIRERKRRKDRASTTREVPMHPRLKEMMRDWFKTHPGGQFTITPPLSMPRRKAKAQLDALSRDEAHHHFKLTLRDSKWEVIRGFHVLRHSFGAICTRGGVPMNVIAKWMGHTTDEMMRLYQHLFPQDEQTWMQKLPL